VAVADPGDGPVPDRADRVPDRADRLPDRLPDRADRADRLPDRADGGGTVGVGGGTVGEAALGAPDPAPGVLGASDLDLLTAALRADAGDVDGYARVLTETLGETLPAGMVEVDRDRSLKDRLAGRPGRATAIRVHGVDRSLELDAGRGMPSARIVREVRGVVIARDPVPLDRWIAALADEIARAAAGSAKARQALAAFLGG